jgi:hypothetical protein
MSKVSPPSSGQKMKAARSCEFLLISYQLHDFTTQETTADILLSQNCYFRRTDKWIHAKSRK